MSVKEEAERRFDAARLRRAFENKDLEAMLDLYTEDAQYRAISKASPPRQAHALRGRERIGELLQEVFGRDLTMEVKNIVVEGDHLAYEEECTYSDGNKVHSITMADLDGGRITRQTTVEAWDE